MATPVTALCASSTATATTFPSFVTTMPTASQLRMDGNAFAIKVGKVQSNHSKFHDRKCQSENHFKSAKMFPEHCRDCQARWEFSSSPAKSSLSGTWCTTLTLKEPGELLKNRVNLSTNFLMICSSWRLSRSQLSHRPTNKIRQTSIFAFFAAIFQVSSETDQFARSHQSWKLDFWLFHKALLLLRFLWVEASVGLQSQPPACESIEKF